MAGYYLFGDSVTLKIDESGRYASAPTFIGTVLHKSPSEFSKFFVAALKMHKAIMVTWVLARLHLITRTAYSS